MSRRNVAPDTPTKGGRHGTTRVTLVLDAAIGEGLVLLDQPLWVCDSTANRRVAERLWSQAGHDRRSVTLITALGPSPEATCIETLSTIDEHHPGWTELVIIGALATPVVRASFAPFGPGAFLESPAGFSFARARRDKTND